MIYLDSNAKIWKLTLVGSPAAVAHIGYFYEARMLPYYGTPPYSFALHAGSLPTGVALDTVSGTISGLLSVIETKTGITIRVTDSAAKTADLIFDIDVQDVDMSFFLSGVPDATASVGVNYSFIPTIHNGSGNYDMTLFGSPDGIEFNSATGEVSGVPTEVGIFNNVYISAEDVHLSVTFAMAPWTIQVFGQPFLNGFYLSESFSEEFTKPLSLYNVVFNPTGKWKTNFPFGNDGESGLTDSPDSRNLPGEKQIYTSSVYLPSGNNPFSLLGGSLFIQAKANLSTDPKTYDPYPRINGIINPGYNTPLAYTSGLLSTQKSFSQLYGYFEAAMIMPTNVGCWPMFWLYNQLGDEIVIAEFFASDPTKIYFGQRKTSPPSSEEFSVTLSDPDELHFYGVMWTASDIIWYIDRVEIYRRPNNDLNQPMFMIINHAVGGSHGNLPENSGGFPASLEVQMVRGFTLSTSPSE